MELIDDSTERTPGDIEFFSAQKGNVDAVCQDRVVAEMRCFFSEPNRTHGKQQDWFTPKEEVQGYRTRRSERDSLLSERSTRGRETQNSTTNTRSKQKSTPTDSPPRRKSHKKVKVLTKWMVRLKTNSKGETGVIVEGFLVDSVTGITNVSDKSLQWRTTFIQDRESSVRLRTSSGTVYKLQGAMAKSEKAYDDDLPPEILKQFKNGFPTNWKELIAQAEVVIALNSLPKTPIGKAAKMGLSKKGSASSKDQTPRSNNSQSEQKQEVKVQSVSDLKLSRSGRKLQPPRAYWRQEIPVYETSGTERNLVAVIQGYEESISLRPKTPGSSRKRTRSATLSSKSSSSKSEGSTKQKLGVKGGISKSRGKGAKKGKKVNASKSSSAKTKKSTSKKSRSGSSKAKSSSKGKEEAGSKSAQEGADAGGDDDEIDLAEIEALLAADTQRRAGGEEGDGIANEMDVTQEDAWDDESKEALKSAYQQVKPDAVDFWGEVAKLVPGKTAQECCNQYNQAFPTPNVLKKGKVNRKRPSSSQDKEEEEAGGEGEGEGEKELEEADGIVLKGNKGTNQRKRELRSLLTEADKEHDDDIFDSTPFKSTPFRQLTRAATLWAPSGAISAPSPLAPPTSRNTVLRHRGGGGGGGGWGDRQDLTAEQEYCGRLDSREETPWTRTSTGRGEEAERRGGEGSN
eukprot:632460-Hanusia_phi.AAC.6